MAFILRLFALIARAPKAIAAIPKTVMPIMTTQVGQSAIDAATKRNGRVFAAYIVVLVVTALVVAFFTWFTWDSGNQVQDAIRIEADARIAEANNAAAQANERSVRIESSNIQLRTDLEHSIAESRTKQTALEVEQRKTAEAQEKAARAQLELKTHVERVALQSGPRILSDRFLKV
jgi:hypothetical protein